MNEGCFSSSPHRNIHDLLPSPFGRGEGVRVFDIARE